MLESVATRIEEQRDLTRYIINLLIFLGLLGTFYGLGDGIPVRVRVQVDQILNTASETREGCGTGACTTTFTFQVLPNNSAIWTTALVSINMNPAPRKNMRQLKRPSPSPGTSRLQQFRKASLVGLRPLSGRDPVRDTPPE
jgi:hypothetical protein